jgi:hypothetical protein
MNGNLTAVTDVKRDADVYRARLRITSAAGFAERELENPRCDILSESVALVIALSADPSSHEHDAADERVALYVAPQASAQFGPLPNPALGIGAGVAVEGIESFGFALRVAYYAPQTTTFARDTTLGGHFNLLTAGLRGCRVWNLGAFDLAPCFGAEFYHVHASGFGGEHPRENEADWWGPTLGFFARLRIVKAFGIYLAADGVVPLSRRRFVFSDVGQLHRASAVALEVLVAPEVRF